MNFVLSAELFTGVAWYWQPLNQQVSKSLLRLENKTYGEDIDSIAIIPMIFPENFYEEHGWKERIYISHKNHYADIRLRIDYKDFLRGPKEKRRKLFFDNIRRSLLVIKPRLRKDFHFDNLYADVDFILRELETETTMKTGDVSKPLKK